MNRLRNVSGVGGRAMEFGCNITSTRAAKEGVDEQWLQTHFLSGARASGAGEWNVRDHLI